MTAHIAVLSDGFCRKLSNGKKASYVWTNLCYEFCKDLRWLAVDQDGFVLEALLQKDAVISELPGYISLNSCQARAQFLASETAHGRVSYSLHYLWFQFTQNPT